MEMIAIITTILNLVLTIFLLAKFKTSKYEEAVKDRVRDEVQDIIRDMNRVTDRNITLLEDSIKKHRAFQSEITKSIKSNKNDLVDRLKTDARIITSGVEEKDGVLAGNNGFISSEPVRETKSTVRETNRKNTYEDDQDDLFFSIKRELEKEESNINLTKNDDDYFKSFNQKSSHNKYSKLSKK